MTLGLIAVADTSGLLATFNRSDPEHAAAQEAANRCGLLVVSAIVLTELHYMARTRAGGSAADHILGVVLRRVEQQRMEIARTTGAQLRTALSTRARYSALDLDLADAVNVVVAAEYRTESILTLDRRDFRAITPLTDHAAFRLLPDDL